jgi:hypothetical protein
VRLLVTATELDGLLMLDDPEGEILPSLERRS